MSTREVSTRVETEDLEITRSEKLLAAVLAVFMLIGGLWTYFNIDDIGRPEPSFRTSTTTIPPAAREAVSQQRSAKLELAHATRLRAAALQALEVRREAYRTTLEAGQPSASAASAYRKAQGNFEQADRRLGEARSRVGAAAPTAQAAERELRDAQRKSFQDQRDRQRSHDRQTFALRLAFVLIALATGYWLLARLRRRRSRYYPTGMAWIGAATLLALVMATDYTTDYVDVFENGPLVLSLAGIAMTMAALAALQRHLARRMPLRRVRRGRCPFCGFPVKDNPHCEGCGRRVTGECSTCHQPRRVATEHCASCGAA